MIAKNAGGRRKKNENAKSKTCAAPVLVADEVATKPLPFAEVVDAADLLTEDEQQELIAIVKRRLSESARNRLIADVEVARREFEAGRCKPATPDELMREIRK